MKYQPLTRPHPGQYQIFRGRIREVGLDPPATFASNRQSDLADLERVVDLAQRLAAANGQPIPPTIIRATYSLMRDHLKALKISRTASGV